MSKVEIITPHPDRGYGSTQVLVDGHDLSYALTRFEVEQDGGDLGPRVTLTLRMIEDKRLCMERAEVALDSSTRDFLTAAGWTPPALTGEAGA